MNTVRETPLVWTSTEKKSCRRNGNKIPYLCSELIATTVSILARAIVQKTMLISCSARLAKEVVPLLSGVQLRPTACRKTSLDTRVWGTGTVSIRNEAGAATGRSSGPLSAGARRAGNSSRDGTARGQYSCAPGPCGFAWPIAQRLARPVSLQIRQAKHPGPPGPTRRQTTPSKGRL